MAAKDDVVGLARFAGSRLWERLDGLTDEEFFWAPVPGAWTMRQVDGVWRGDAGPDGTIFSAPDPPPVTTIAWRLWHLGAVDVRGWPPSNAADAQDFVRQWFSATEADDPGVGAAAEAVALLRRNWEAFVDRIERFSAEELDAPMGPAAGQYAESSLLALVLHAVDEFIHHAAEVSLLRDLYAAQPAG
jgi:uncharacterized damage-inducible protein DinB